MAFGLLSFLHMGLRYRPLSLALPVLTPLHSLSLLTSYSFFILKEINVLFQRNCPHDCSASPATEDQVFPISPPLSAPPSYTQCHLCCGVLRSGGGISRRAGKWGFYRLWQCCDTLTGRIWRGDERNTHKFATRGHAAGSWRKQWDKNLPELCGEPFWACLTCGESQIRLLAPSPLWTVALEGKTQTVRMSFLFFWVLLWLAGHVNHLHEYSTV